MLEVGRYRSTDDGRLALRALRAVALEGAGQRIDVDESFQQRVVGIDVSMNLPVGDVRLTLDAVKVVLPEAKLRDIHRGIELCTGREEVGSGTFEL